MNHRGTPRRCASMAFRQNYSRQLAVATNVIACVLQPNAIDAPAIAWVVL
jgi:hypothetical protein